MSIWKSFKNTVLTGALLAGSLFATQKAYSQDTYNEDNKPAKTEKTAPILSLTDDNIERKVDVLLRGSLQAKAETDPLVDRLSASAQFEWMTGNLRPYLGIQDVFEKWDNIDGSKLEVNSLREIAALGIYLENTPKQEIYLRAILGNENSKFSDAIKMDSQRLIYGVEAGLASVEKGYKLLAKFYKGNGKFDAELESGFEIDGDLDTTYAGLEGRFALSREGKRRSGSSEFDKRQDEREANFTLDLLADVYWNRNEFVELEQDDTIQFKLGPSFTWNYRDEKGNGGIWNLTTYGVYKNLETESGISLRQTQTTTMGGGATFTYSPTPHWSLSVLLGVNKSKQTIDDPGQNFDRTETRSGVTAAFIIRYDF